MTRYVIVLNSKADRERAAKYIAAAPAGTRVEIKATRRTTPQNSLFWSLLSDIAEQIPWHGIRLRPDDYKVLFMDALKKELRAVPNLNDDGFCNLGRSSSDLSKGEMSELIDFIVAWGTQKNVKFKLLPPIEERT